MGVVNVLEEMRKSKRPCAVVVVTSDKCYENKEWHYGYRETDRLGGGDPYSASKAAAEILIESYRRAYFPPGDAARHQVGIASARAGNVIGGGDWAEDRIVPDCVRALSSGGTVHLRSPDAVRPWQHVLEPVSGYLELGAALLSDRGSEFCEAWNFGPDSASVWSVRSVVDKVIECWGGGNWKADAASGPGESTLLSLSIEKTRARLGWSPRWTLERTIVETVDWYRAFTDGRGMREVCESQISAYEENRS
jgi:CDP-glucose 4,6-dehydratase